MSKRKEKIIQKDQSVSYFLPQIDPLMQITLATTCYLTQPSQNSTDSSSDVILKTIVQLKVPQDSFMENILTYTW